MQTQKCVTTEWKDSYPLNGSCQLERSIYQATVTRDDDPTYYEKFFIGLAEPNLKNVA